MKTRDLALFEMFVIALKEGIENPVLLAVSKTNGRLSLAAMTADDLVLEADGGFYLAFTGPTLTVGSQYHTSSETFELIALRHEAQGVAVWYAQPVRAEQLPEIAKPWPSTSPA
jgi:hypothetical protein